MDRKELIRKYKATPRPAGVYRILNTRTGRALVGTSVDVPAMLNRQRLQLRTGGHPNHTLQHDWNAEGADAFTFEVLDTLTPGDDPAADLSEELRLLETLWLEKLALTDENRY
ncbi:MAG TPA: GIY-YIG nuclease family protein [Longimicrobiales bacterium]|nr:GIY-YIG nuclease family protein [Longimicrobiales bacterium]